MKLLGLDRHKLYHLFTCLLLPVCATIPSTELLAQRKPGAAIIGKITDAETSSPLENVIVFLSNTPYGISTGNNGHFILLNVPLGKYELVASRVGYERQTISLNVAATDSFFFDIKLKPTPVRMIGVEVEAIPPEQIKPKLFVPQPSDGTYCLYGTAYTLPIGILFTGSALYMYALEPTIIDSGKYIRLWLLYRNLSGTAYIFDPVKYITLRVSNKKISYRGITPDLPQKVQTEIHYEEAMASAQEKIGKPLQHAAAQYEQGLARELKYLRKNLTREQYEHYIENDRRLPLSGSMMNNTFTQSVNNGILRRHTVYPGNSVHGYVFFPFPGLDWKAAKLWLIEALEYEYEIEISTPSGVKQIVFSPH